MQDSFFSEGSKGVCCCCCQCHKMKLWIIKSWQCSAQLVARHRERRAKTPSAQSYIRSDRRSEENKPIKALFSPTEEGKKETFPLQFLLLFATGKRTKIETQNWARRRRRRRWMKVDVVGISIDTIRRQTGRGEAKVENVQRRKTKHLAWAFIDLTIKQCWARFFFSSKYFSYIHNTTHSTQRVRENCEEGNFPFSAFTSLWYFFFSYSSFSFFLFQNKSRQSLMDIFISFLQRNGWIEVGISVAIYLAFFHSLFPCQSFSSVLLCCSPVQLCWNNFHNFALISVLQRAAARDSTRQLFISQLRFASLFYRQWCWLGRNLVLRNRIENLPTLTCTVVGGLLFVRWILPSSLFIHLVRSLCVCVGGESWK